MRISTQKVGELRTNCYIVADEATRSAVIIDPGAEPEKLYPDIQNLKIEAVLLTHGHYDHVTSAFRIKEKTGAPVLMHAKDEAMMAYSTGQKADKLVKDGDTIELGNLSFSIIETPGHSHGSVCLYNEKEKTLFSGDTLFYHDHGRCDLPGSSQSEMLGSLKKLLGLPPETVVYPGHGRPTTISDEKNLLE